MLSFVAVDPNDPVHFNLFHTWHNDPRVSAGWNEQGDEEHHRKYLQAQIDDPHTLAVFGAWDNVLFAYYEFTWTKVR